MLQYFWPHIILDTCTHYTFNIFGKKQPTPIRSTLPKASPNSETPPSKHQRNACLFMGTLFLSSS